MCLVVVLRRYVTLWHPGEEEPIVFATSTMHKAFSLTVVYYQMVRDPGSIPRFNIPFLVEGISKPLHPFIPYHPPPLGDDVIYMILKLLAPQATFQNILKPGNNCSLEPYYYIIEKSYYTVHISRNKLCYNYHYTYYYYNWDYYNQ